MHNLSDILTGRVQPTREQCEEYAKGIEAGREPVSIRTSDGDIAKVYSISRRWFSLKVRFNGGKFYSYLSVFDVESVIE